MTPFNMTKVARGFLELLAARNLGRTPMTCADELQPVLDMREFYAQSQVLVSSGAPTVGPLVNMTDTFSFTNALGVKGIGGSLVIGAAAATNVSVAIGVNIGGTAMALGSWFYAQIPAGGIVEFGVVIPNWVLPAGSSIFARAEGTAAGADHTLDSSAIIENYVSGV